jgi:hypothetical protein
MKKAKSSDFLGDSSSTKSSKKHLSSKDNSSLTLETNTEESLENVKKELKLIQTNLNKTIYELSTEHKVVLIFIKWFGCPM